MAEGYQSTEGIGRGYARKRVSSMRREAAKKGEGAKTRGSAVSAVGWGSAKRIVTGRSIDDKKGGIETRWKEQGPKDTTRR